MLSETHILGKFNIGPTKNKVSRKTSLANIQTAKLKADSETASPNFGSWDLDKKKEQFLTIDRF
tara:strand:- start:6 stop:197 length:192 start_codon:yes stop_codon:yes gene_type:complete